MGEAPARVQTWDGLFNPPARFGVDSGPIFSGGAIPGRSRAARFA